MLSSSILLYGQDQHLLETRSHILEKSGYQVWMASTLRDLEQLSKTQDLDLVILCHSVPLEDSGRALAFCQSHWPFMKRLILSGPNSWCTQGLSDPVFEIAQGPAKLLSTLVSLLNHERDLCSGARD
jgi:DNA-binding NtrC family response regulator